MALDVVTSGPLFMSEITVTDNGVVVPPEHLRPISPQTGTDATAQLVFVVDAVNSSFEDVTRTEEAIEHYLGGLPGQLPAPTSIVVFSDTAAEQRAPGGPPDVNTVGLHGKQLFAHRTPVSRDGGSLIRALQEYRLGLPRILRSQVGDGQFERVELSLEALDFLARAKAGESGPKLVLWLGPGWPYLRPTTAAASRKAFDSVVYFTGLLRSARMVVDSISPEGLTAQQGPVRTEGIPVSSRPGRSRLAAGPPTISVGTSDSCYKGFLKPVRKASEASANNLALQVLAIQSGGVVVQESNDVAGQIARCAAAVNSIQSFVYDPGATTGGPTYHAIEVRRVRDHERMRVLEGFYSR